MTDLSPTRAASLAPPDPTNLQARLDWLAARYYRNSGDEDFEDWFGDIMQPGPDGRPGPVAVRDPLAEETKGLAVIAPSEEGKSSLIRRNLSALPGFRRQTAEAEGNYLAVIVKPEGTIKSLAAGMLQDTGYGRVAAAARGHELWDILRHRLQLLGIQLIWIDEAHHLLRPGPGRDVAQARQKLKNLMQGPGATALLLSGVPELDGQLLADRETDRRIPRRLLDRRFGAQPRDAQRLAKFTEVCCGHLDLKPPADPFFAERMVFAGNGSLGATLALLKDTLRRSLISGDGVVDLAHARRPHEARHGRRNVGPFDEGRWEVIRGILERERET
ncbi:MAG: TniB family NTP-binding protein [Alkalilacustris sp.]